MAYQRKTEDEYEIQGDYGCGWELLTTEETYREARKMLGCYRYNESGRPYRIIKKRVKLDA